MQFGVTDNGLNVLITVRICNSCNYDPKRMPRQHIIGYQSFNRNPGNMSVRFWYRDVRFQKRKMRMVSHPHFLIDC